MTELQQEDWRTEIAKADAAVILDVRTPAEWAEGIIPGAIKMNIMNGAEFLEEIQNLDPSRPHFVYCRSGGRSAQACMMMGAKGFDRTYNLVGGVMEWDEELER